MSRDAGAPTVVLATDLGMRCDRATARAKRLADASAGAGIAATVVAPADAIAREVLARDAPAWYLPVSPLVRARNQLQREFEERDGWSVRIGEGEPAAFLGRQLDEAGDDALVVTGPVREGVLGPTVLGSTVDALLRRPRLSLLVVREPVQADYRRLLVTTDFSAPSGQALLRARALFPAASLVVLHGFGVPMLGMMDTGQDEAIAQAARQAHEQGQDFLRDCGLGDGEATLLVEHGDPARLVRQHLDTYGDSLVVAGTHGRGAMYALVVGSVARRIVASGDADVLLVRG